MRRALNLLGAMALTALITYLWLSKNMADERSALLADALANTEARVAALEAEIESTALQLELLKRTQRTQLRTLSSSREQHTAISVVERNQNPGDVSLSAFSTTPPAESEAAHPEQVSSGPWYSYV